MAGLAVMYSKEVVKELTKIAVVLPGEPVSVGDIITFTDRWYRRPKPLGSFDRVSDLQSLEVPVELAPMDNDSDAYVFASRKWVDVSFDAGVEDSTGAGSGKLTIAFRKEGKVYLAAFGCTRVDLADLASISVDLNKHHRNSIVWQETFLVTSVTTAKRALVMQASTSEAVLEVGGEVSGLVPGGSAGTSANASLAIKRGKDAAFLKPWSDNVTMFLGLHRFKPKHFGLRPFAEDLLAHPEDTWELVPVSPHEVVEEEVPV